MVYLGRLLLIVVIWFVAGMLINFIVYGNEITDGPVKENETGRTLHRIINILAVVFAFFALID